MRSRTHSDNDPSTGSIIYVSEAENMILPDGAVSRETAELLGDLITHEQEETVVSPGDLHQSKSILPWWKKPSPFWLVCLTPLTAIAMAATLAPRVEIYTMLACREHRPEIFEEQMSYLDLSFLIPRFGVPGIPLASSSPGWTSALHTGGIVIDGIRQPNPCASDPVVQAAVAKLTVAITTLTGVLSCLTTGWWGALSDRRGRTRVLGISVIGVLVTDINFIFVTLASQKIPGGYWALLLGPLIDGSVGGVTTAAAAMHAYMADTTTESTRQVNPTTLLTESRYLSLTLGLLFTGLGIGPTFGALLIRVTGQTLSVFYAATIMHLIYAITVWFFLPESLTIARMHQSLVKYRTDVSDAARDREAVLRQGGVGNPLKRKKRDWNLTLLALGYASNVTIMGSYSYKFQYAASTFKWDSETIGYWISLVGAVRAIVLTIFSPQTKLVHRLPARLPLPDADQSHSFSHLRFESCSRITLYRHHLILVYEHCIYPTAIHNLVVVYLLRRRVQPRRTERIFGNVCKEGRHRDREAFGALSVIQALCLVRIPDELAEHYKSPRSKVGKTKRSLEPSLLGMQRLLT
ncbi:major facilitator superfamily domain-containing protein [Infundibulicybe gibba]|nr:major facilitator superfamily domain-containing protein [Infundibulicybe gibba]